MRSISRKRLSSALSGTMIVFEAMRKSLPGSIKSQEISASIAFVNGKDNAAYESNLSINRERVAKMKG